MTDAHAMIWLTFTFIALVVGFLAGCDIGAGYERRKRGGK